MTKGEAIEWFFQFKANLVEGRKEDPDNNKYKMALEAVDVALQAIKYEILKKH